MSWINNITKENFEESFDLNKILEKSTFYPASGIDFNKIEGLLQFSNSFIHVDYSLSADRVEEALRSDIRYHGVELIGLRRIAQNELSPNGFTPNNLPLKDSEEERIFRRNVAVNYNNPFCFWAVYEIDINEQFSVLHIGGEAVEAFDTLYVNNAINPIAVAIFNPGEGYGDNWTEFTNPEYRLFNLMQLNSERNSFRLPEYIFTNKGDGENCFWPNYIPIDSETIKRDLGTDHECYIYQLINEEPR